MTPENEGGVPSRLIKTEPAPEGRRKEGTPMMDVRTLPSPESSEEIVLTLDELAREGARRMIAPRCARRPTTTLPGSPTSSTRTVIGWSSATGALADAR
jgi:hypothetical protein